VSFDLRKSAGKTFEKPTMQADWIEKNNYSKCTLGESVKKIK